MMAAELKHAERNPAHSAADLEIARRARRPRVYVAGPMSAGDFDENIARGIAVGSVLALDGYAPLVPHFDAYLPNREDLSWRDFLEIDLPWVRVADAILRLDGPSEGADLECRVAQAHGIPVFRSLEELNAWRRAR